MDAPLELPAPSSTLLVAIISESVMFVPKYRPHIKGEGEGVYAGHGDAPAAHRDPHQVLNLLD
jgi:hypothetical protein